MVVMGRTERIFFQACCGNIPFSLEETAFEMQCPWLGLAGSGYQGAQKSNEKKDRPEIGIESFGYQCFMKKGFMDILTCGIYVLNVVMVDIFYV